MRIIEYKNLKWIDIFEPTEEEMQLLKKKFGFHSLILEEIKTPTYHPLIEIYRRYLFLILHFPNFDAATEQIHGIEIDFLITKRALITIRYQNFSDFEEIFQEAEKKPTQYFNGTTGYLFHGLIKKLFIKTFPEIDRIKEEIDKNEDQIFQAFDEKIIEQLASIKHQVLSFIRFIKPQKIVWDAAPEILISFWGESLKPYILDLIADYNRTLHLVETHKEIIDSLHLTSSSLLDNKRNHVVKILTIFTAILLPLSLFASIYGMNLANLPFSQDPSTFWWLLFGMFIVTVFMLIFFHKRKWL